ncbi:MAG: ParB/RepB/Spo0J family partition protein [Pirellulales bacterium]
MQPILVSQVGGRYQLISGERRLRAAIHAGLKTIRAEVREADDRLVAELAIVENLQRKDLDTVKRQCRFVGIDQHRCTRDDLAKRLKKIDRSTIANLMRLLELPEEIQQCVQNDTVTRRSRSSTIAVG